MKNNFFLFFIIIFLGCSSSPRYTSENIIYGVASHYGHNDGFHGQLTANGEIFDQYSLSAAHKTLPLPCGLSFFISPMYFHINTLLL